MFPPRRPSSNYLPSIINFQRASRPVIRSKSQFWTILYTRWRWEGKGGWLELATVFPRSPSAPARPLDVHPVNYFVSGYLQRAVNSCRADYTDRFIALVSQSNVRNAPPHTSPPTLFRPLSVFLDSPPLARDPPPLLRGFRFGSGLFRLRRFHIRSHIFRFFPLWFLFSPVRV